MDRSIRSQQRVAGLAVALGVTLALAVTPPASAQQIRPIADQFANLGQVQMTRQANGRLVGWVNQQGRIHSNRAQFIFFNPYPPASIRVNVRTLRSAQGPLDLVGLSGPGIRSTSRDRAKRSHTVSGFGGRGWYHVNVGPNFRPGSTGSIPFTVSVLVSPSVRPADRFPTIGLGRR